MGEDSKNKKKGDKTISEEAGMNTSEINNFVSDNDDAPGFEPPDDSDSEVEQKKTKIRGRIKQGKAKTNQESDNEGAGSKESLFDQIKNTKKKKSNTKDTSKTDKSKGEEDDDDVDETPEGLK